MSTGEFTGFRTNHQQYDSGFPNHKQVGGSKGLEGVCSNPYAPCMEYFLPTLYIHLPGQISSRPHTTEKSSNGGLVKEMGPLISGKSRLVK